MPITTLVVRNVEVHEFTRMDTGKIRTMAGMFGIEGETAGSTLAGALRLLYLYNRNILAMPFPPQPTHDELKADYRAWPLIHESLAVRSWCPRILSPSTTVFFHFLFARIDAEAANRFFVQLSRGEGLVHDMPVYILREKLTSIQRNKGLTIMREVYTLLIKAWNAFIDGRQLRRLSWSPHEPFPRVSNPSRRPQPPKEPE
jgi:hypothetical protein